MLEKTIYGNCFLVVTPRGIPIGYQENGEIKFAIGDRVKVTGDICGFICPGITEPGLAHIAEICRDSSDHHFYVIMDNGQSGYVKSARITRIDV